MDEIKELAEKIRRDPEKYKGKNVIIGLGDDEAIDLFIAGNPLKLAEMLGTFIDDLKKGIGEEYLN